MKITSPFLRVLLALLATVVFYYCLMHSSFGMDVPLPFFDIHQVVQVIVPASFFFIALYPCLRAKLHPLGIVSFSLAASIFSEFVLLIMFGVAAA